MKSLYQTILESNEFDLLVWQLNEWFINHESEKEEFMNIIINCQHDNGTNNVEKYLNETNYLKQSYQQLLEFVNGDIKIQQDANYIYQLQNLIKELISNKSPKNKYVKNC